MVEVVEFPMFEQGITLAIEVILLFTWSCGYGFERSWVRIPGPYTGWTIGHFFTLICCKKYIVCLKRPKKRPGLAH